MPGKNQTNWSSYLKVVMTALPKAAAFALRDRYQHWERVKGKAWVVDRQKSVLSIAKLLKNGELELAREVANEASIRVDSYGVPTGPEGIAVRTVVNTTSVPKLRRAFAVLRAYTGLYEPEPSSKQLRKAMESITGDYKGTWVRNTNPKFLMLDKYSSQIIPKEWPKAKISRELPIVTRLSGTSSYSHLSEVAIGKRKPYASMVASLLTKGLVPEPLMDFYDSSFDFVRSKAESFQVGKGDDTLGKITVIMENGVKARVVCAPNAWIQMHLQPLHRYLSDVILTDEKKVHDKYGISCMFDQQRGAYIVREKMAEGSFCSSVDLSGATDNFPLELQQGLLKKLNLPEFAEAFDGLKGPYHAPDGTKWSYSKGQPMGAYGSFPLFHLTHLTVLRHISAWLGLSPTDVNFCVLGDDVVLFDEGLERTYRWYMSFIGVEISESKSYSGSLVEFAGFVIGKLSNGRTFAFRPYKWGKSMEFSSILNTISNVGAPVSKWGSWWQSAYELAIRTMGGRSLDLSPLVKNSKPSEGITQVVTEEYLVGLYNKQLHNYEDSYVSFGSPLIFDVDYQSTPKHNGDYASSFLPPRHEGVVGFTFDPVSYWKEETQMKRKFRSRKDFLSDPLVNLIRRVND